MDRIDIWMPVARIDYERLAAQASKGESSDTVRARVAAARIRQTERFRTLGKSICYNSEMSTQDIDECVSMNDDARMTLQLSAEKLGLSGRAFHRVIKVAQTIADLADQKCIKKDFVLEALQYREKN
jgi:magnesium chelatase family protein